MTGYVYSFSLAMREMLLFNLHMWHAIFSHSTFRVFDASLAQCFPDFARKFPWNLQQHQFASGMLYAAERVNMLTGKCS